MDGLAVESGSWKQPCGVYFFCAASLVRKKITHPIWPPAVQAGPDALSGRVARREGVTVAEKTSANL
jgi:hypothetical protein